MKIPDLTPYTLILKVIGIAVAVVALVGLTMSWLSRGQEIASLTAWQKTVVISTTNATVTPNAKGIRKSLSPDQVPAAIAALKWGYDSAVGSLERATAETDAAKRRADIADQALANGMIAFDNRYASAEKRIAAMDKRKPAVDLAKVCANMDADSKAAWEGWR